MTTGEIKTLFTFNTWATNKLLETLAQIPEAQYLQDMKSSHGGMHGTLVHIIAAQKMWLSRWVGKPDASLVQASSYPAFNDARKLWEQVDADTQTFVHSLTDEKIQSAFSMTTMRGETFSHMYGQAMQHLINHSSYHRGQIVTMIRQIGMKPPATDMIAYFRTL